ncbi:MAG: ABC transporter permease [Porticoccus sp.]|nr:ABC transporter permease [Porticoccus sp.]MBQ0807553.1 ABC transporter permease [Porticoccus sp.]
MRQRHLKALLRWLSIVGFLCLWQLVVWWFEPSMLPSPPEVFTRLLAQWDSGELPQQLWVTVLRVLGSFFSAILLGAFLGIAMGHLPWLDSLLDGVVTIALNIPALVVIILCFIWFGLNELSVISAVVINKAPSMIVIFREGARAIDFKLLEVARVFGLPWWRSFFQVYLPQLYPYFLAATRSGLALVWKIVLVVELLGCSDGVGFQLGVFFQYFDITGILAYTSAFVLLILSIEVLLIRPWEKSVMRWRG